MAAPRVYKTEAIVLRRTPLGEADCIVTLFTPRQGKIRAVAKGVRKSRSKLGGHLEPLTQSALMLARGQNLDIITQGQTTQSFLSLRDDLWRTGCALYAAELVDAFTAEHQENYQVYQLLTHTLGWLCRGPHQELALRYFELRLLGYLGYQPELYQCVNCKSAIEPRLNFFSASGGGVLCPDCRDSEVVVHPLSLNALKAMRFLQGCNPAEADRLRLNAELARELEQLMREYIRYILEREVKSVRFLDRVRREN